MSSVVTQVLWAYSFELTLRLESRVFRGQGIPHPLHLKPESRLLLLVAKNPEHAVSSRRWICATKNDSISPCLARPVREELCGCALLYFFLYDQVVVVMVCSLHCEHDAFVFDVGDLESVYLGQHVPSMATLIQEQPSSYTDVCCRRLGPINISYGQDKGGESAVGSSKNTRSRCFFTLFDEHGKL